jgi:hypothetical protein
MRSPSIALQSAQLCALNAPQCGQLKEGAL